MSATPSLVADPPPSGGQGSAAPHALSVELKRDKEKLRREIALTVLTGVGLATGLVATFVAEPARGSLPTLAWIGYGLAYLAGGLPAGYASVKKLLTRGKLSISFLMVLAAVAAALVGEVRDGAILLFLYSLAETLEGYAMGNTKRAVAALMELRPETANVVVADGDRATGAADGDRAAAAPDGDHATGAASLAQNSTPMAEFGGRTKVVAVDRVSIGQRIVVRPGERVPLDGKVLAGSGAVDQSPITGESVPVDIEPGDEVFAGSVNGYSSLTVEVTKDAASSTLARMIHLVTVAQAQRSPSQRFSDWFGQRYTFLVLIGAVVALGVFFLVGMSSQSAFYKAATLLVVASPCAIVISVPAAVLSALARSARLGVLFKGGGAIEEFGAIERIALDKTGTLTEAKMRVVDVKPFGISRAELLAVASAIESHSEHPVAVAIRNAGEEEFAASGMPVPSASNLVAVPGKGITAELVGGTELVGATGLVGAKRWGAGAYWAGNLKLAASVGARLEPEVSAAVAQLEAGGRTVVLVGKGGHGAAATVLGVIAVADTVRPTSAAALSALRAAGVSKISMLTGDNAVVATAVADELGIDREEVHAGLLPTDKVALVERYRQESTVAFVGDGVNDAAALATASVGVAMGAAGTDVALEAADIALLSNDLTKLPQAHELARRTNTVIRQNLTFALGIMLVMVAFTLFGDLPLPLGVLGHEGGTILVVLNGLRLLGWQPSGDSSPPVSPAINPRLSGRRA